MNTVYVNNLKSFVTCLLDKFLSVNDAKDLKNPVTGGSIGKPKLRLFTCDVCDWQTRFGAALKGHKKRMHSKSQTCTSMNGLVNCDQCEFKTLSKVTLYVHIETTHKQEKRKRPTVTFRCEILKCDSTFGSDVKLHEHMQSQHGDCSFIDAKTMESQSSPCSSPPRKKLDEDPMPGDLEVEMTDLDDVELITEKELNLNALLEKRN